jgi:hypothetical protein
MLWRVRLRSDSEFPPEKPLISSRLMGETMGISNSPTLRTQPSSVARLGSTPVSRSSIAAVWNTCYRCGFREKQPGEDYCAQCAYKTEKAAAAETEQRRRPEEEYLDVLIAESTCQNTFSNASRRL